MSDGDRLVLLGWVLALLVGEGGCSTKLPVQPEAGVDLFQPGDRPRDLRSALLESSVAECSPADQRNEAARPDLLATDRGPNTDANPFPKNHFGCMGTQSTLSLLGGVGNVSIFAGCQGVVGSYLLVWGGAIGALTPSDLSAIKAAPSAALFAIPGVWAHGISLCCVPSTNQACISVSVSANTITIWDLARHLDTILTGEPQCLGVVADVPGKLSPRCDASDPDCLPIPICGGIQNPPCCSAPLYSPVASRVPTLPKNDPLFSLELPQAPGECAHDGECMLNGCGNSCNAYTAPKVPGICPCYPVLTSSFCGCVNGECVWYEQK
jgi:hypothetical protein